MRDIKTKQKMQAIKTKDTKGNIRHFIKQQTIHNKKSDRKEDASVKSNPQVQATNKVSVAAKQSVIESKHRATKFIKKNIMNIRSNQLIRNQLLNQIVMFIRKEFLIYPRQRSML